MSRTHCESGERASIHSSDGTEEVANLSRVDGAAGPVPSSVTCAEPSLSVGSNNWATAEGAAHEIIRKISPTSVSEERRRDVIDYIQRLIKNCLCFQVLPYGSVPLKTYLPDGDIDLTVFGGANVEDLLADDMKFVLEEEEKNPMAEYVVKDVQVIHAEVKLVKCIVQNIVVDISFNQIGGLCTLCFLEQIDRFIGKDHLFKRSIILIKAWCYYESRILGAHHGLISTYALETLVLYIFHIYHSTLDGPLAVLYKFLEYFSKFDWETYCITLSGPVRLSSLPAIVVEMPEDSCGDLLLTSDFFSSCVDMFSVPSKGGEKSSRGFQQKHLNIIDPLKETNNLGRSVSKGNFYRVRSAFTYGARKLRQILLQPENAIPNELHKFFSNTMSRHGERQMPDVQDFDPSLTCNGPIPKVPISESGLCRIDKSMSEECKEYTVLTGDPRSTSGIMANGEQAGIFVSKHSTLSKLISPSHRFHGDANDLATSGLGGLTISNDSSTCQTPTLIDKVNSAGMPYHAPHLYFAHSKLHNGSMKDGNPDSDKLNKCEKTSALVLSGSNGVIISADESLEKSQSVDKDEVAASCKQKDVHLSSESSSFSRDLNRQWASTTRSGTSESLNSLTGLSGDYDSYFRCLQYGRSCYEYSSGLHSLHMPPSPTAPYQIINPWDGAPPPMQFNQNGFSNQHHNGFHSSQHMYAMPHLLIPGMTFGWEEMPKPRGTGTYFPNMNQSPQGYRPSSITGRNKASSRPHYNHGRSMAYSEPSMLDRASHEQLQSHVPGSADSFQSFSPRGNGFHKANGSIIHADGVVEFGSVDHAPGTPTSEKSKQQKSESSSPRNSSVMQKSQLPLSREKDRISLRSSYRLKDEEDFPPLSV